MRARVARWAWLLGLTGGCGGGDFTTAVLGADGGDSAAVADTGSQQEGGTVADASSAADGVTQDSSGNEGGGDASSLEGGPVTSVRCGANVCSGATPVCCASGSQCAHVECGCGTQLECARNLDCPVPLPMCCIGNRQDLTCATSHFVAACATGCRNGGMQLCDPNGSQQQCQNGQCSTDSGDLSNVGLSPNSGLGVCK